MGAAFGAAGEAILLIGETRGHLGQSSWLRVLHGREDGPPPPVDLAAERRNGDLVRGQILNGAVTAAHDLSDGGLLVAVADMAMAGGTGATIDAGDASSGWAFGEDQARYLVTTSDAGALLTAAEAAGVPAQVIGKAGGDAVAFGDSRATIAALRGEHERFLPELMAR